MGVHFVEGHHISVVWVSGVEWFILQFACLTYLAKLMLH